MPGVDEEILHRVLAAGHDALVRRVRAALAAGAVSRGEDPGLFEGRAAREGAGDLSFEIDLPAEDEVAALGEELGRLCPVRLVSEGIGSADLGAGSPELRVIVDPIDGTRNLSHDLRSGWVLTAVASERGENTTIRDVFLCRMTEIPTRDRTTYEVLWATRGAGTVREVRALDDGRLLGRGVVRAPEELPDARGYYVFFRYVPEDRVPTAKIEEAFLTRLCRETGVDRRTLLDDHYISNGGQIHLLLTRRYRFLADLRAWLGDRLGYRNVCSKPYDVCCALLAEEAGVPLRAPDGGDLDFPLDTEARVSFVGYMNEALRRRLEPILLDVLAGVEAPHGGRA